MEAGEAPVRARRIRGYRSREERETEILALLDRRPELRRKDVAESLAITRARAGQLVNIMVREGLVKDEGPGGLLTTDAGRRLLEGQDPGKPPVELRTGQVTITNEDDE